ncbi:hypothetical protein MIR68_002677 [Amoeboaphelidium protococcarum]|nr:hypothetical protein MIR68_002677 [Amoeboaphelidium protococcarum]
MFKLPKISRGQAIFGTVFTSIGSLYGYDRYKTNQIMSYYQDLAAEQIALQSTQSWDEKPRKLIVYAAPTLYSRSLDVQRNDISDDKAQDDPEQQKNEFSESQTHNAYRELEELKWAFREFAKPVLDAGAIDYELKAEPVAIEALIRLIEKDLDEQQNARQVDGYLALGRIAFKSFLIATQNKKQLVADTVEDIQDIQVAASDKLPDRRWFFQRWFGQNKPAVTQDNEQASNLSYDSQRDQPSSLKFGYISHTAPSNPDFNGNRWYVRWPKSVVSFFNRRSLAEKMARSAFAAALGNSVNLSLVIPGDISLSLLGSDDKAIELDVNDQVIISEDVTSQIEMFQVAA